MEGGGFIIFGILVIITILAIVYVSNKNVSSGTCTVPKTNTCSTGQVPYCKTGDSDPVCTDVSTVCGTVPQGKQCTPANCVYAASKYSWQNCTDSKGTCTVPKTNTCSTGKVPYCKTGDSDPVCTDVSTVCGTVPQGKQCTPANCVYDYTASKYSWQNCTGGTPSSFKGMNSACPCEPTTLLKSGKTGGLLADVTQFPGSNIIISILNNNSKTAYFAVVCIPSPGSPQVLIKNGTIDGNTLYREGFNYLQMDAGRIYVTYDSGIAAGFTKLPGTEPTSDVYLLIEMTILKSSDGIWTNGGDISYVDSIGIPALLYFGPNDLSQVDTPDIINNKLSFTTCTQEQLTDDCPTMVNNHGFCISPDIFCSKTDTSMTSQPNWKQVCDDDTGDMNVYIKKFGISNDLFTNPTDKTAWTISRFIYSTANPYNYILDPTLSVKDRAYDMGSFYWPNAAKTASATSGSYSWTDDEEKLLFTGQVSNGNISGGPDSVNPTPTGTRILAYNSTLNGEAISLGLCNPDDLVNECGSTGGDFMARYTQQSADLNNYTKKDTHMGSDITNWFSGKYPYNRYAKYVVEHTNLTYGFPYQEGTAYGGYTSSKQTDIPQMMVVLYPTCTSIDSLVSRSKTM